ncbi:hypothetical protein F5B18DRAFT_622393 [Nemania serpens]|nr:hypothetical protein F5B18DRAFT_622393 [Nemania serpens]
MYSSSMVCLSSLSVHCSSSLLLSGHDPRLMYVIPCFLIVKFYNVLFTQVNLELVSSLGFLSTCRLEDGFLSRDLFRTMASSVNWGRRTERLSSHVRWGW